jgi:hypothetical protein
VVRAGVAFAKSIDNIISFHSGKGNACAEMFVSKNAFTVGERKIPASVDEKKPVGKCADRPKRCLLTIFYWKNS